MEYSIKPSREVVLHLLVYSDFNDVKHFSVTHAWKAFYQIEVVSC